MGFELDIVTRRIWIMSLVRIADATLSAAGKFTFSGCPKKGANGAFFDSASIVPRITLDEYCRT